MLKCPVPCQQMPCLNGATCTNNVGSRTCKCATGYSGSNCQIGIKIW